MFRGNDKQPTSEIMAQIDVVPPDLKTYKITQVQGNSRGEKMVRELLDRETESAKKGHGSEINRTNYDFVFLRQENFGIVPEYVLQIVPKRDDKYLLRGQIWLDASTYGICRIEGVPAKSPSFWIKDIHITLQCAEVNGMWIPTSFDAIAAVRLLGRYTLARLTIPARDPLSTSPHEVVSPNELKTDLRSPPRDCRPRSPCGGSSKPIARLVCVLLRSDDEVHGRALFQSDRFAQGIG